MENASAGYIFPKNPIKAITAVDAVRNALHTLACGKAGRNVRPYPLFP